MKLKRMTFPGWYTLVIFIVGAILSCRSLTADFDVIIRDGHLIDGSGAPGYGADLGIKDGKIAEIGTLAGKTARKEIDGAGLVVAPGFIDMHTHVDRKLLDLPAVENYIRQGVTTVVAGNCGSSPYPIGKFLQKAQRKGIALNLALLVGHNTVRKEVMGTQNRASTPEELQKMQTLVETAMLEGAFGISTGLKYVPGAYAGTDEVVALAKVVASHGGFYATHMREEGLGLLDALQEALEVGHQAKLPVQISHHKVVGKSMWGSSVQTLALIEHAVAEGLEVTVDQYPYTATSTGLTVVFPAWSLEGGEEKITERLNDPETRQRIKDGIVHNILYDRGGGDPASIVIAGFETDPALEGKNLAEVTQLRGREPTPANAAETLMELQAEGGGRGIYHCLNEEDLVRIMQHPLTMHASDGATIEFGKAKPHPRSYGTYPRVLGHYVREKQVISLPEAVRKMTGLPAKRVKLADRGLLKVGMWGDIVVFDPETVSDTATWSEPHQYPGGIACVLVNGETVIENGKWMERYPGEILYGPAKR